MIDRDGLHKMPEKTNVIVKAPASSNVSQMRSYIGLVNYYHRSLSDLATLLRPLHELLEKHKDWNWSKSCDVAFWKSKELVTSDLVLTHYGPSLQLRVTCEASPYGLGAVLSHVVPDNSEKPLSFHAA